MTHDFAKIRPEPILERKSVESPPAWSFMLTGIIVGITIGVFASVLFYLSGNVPPLTPGTPALALGADAAQAQLPGDEVAIGESELELEFYHALPNYEVPVEATPVELTPEQSGESVPVNYVLQTGAFQQRDLAEREVQRQQGLGLDAFIKTEILPGRTWHLVQSGPYTESRELNAAEQILRRNNIPTRRLTPD